MADYDVRSGLINGMIALMEPQPDRPTRETSGNRTNRQNIIPQDGQLYTPPTPLYPQDESVREFHPSNTASADGSPRGLQGVSKVVKYVNPHSIKEITPLSDSEIEIIYGFATETTVSLNIAHEQFSRLLPILR